MTKTQGLLVSLFGVGFLVLQSLAGHEAYIVATRGTEALGTVTEYAPVRSSGRRSKGIKHYHLIEADGHSFRTILAKRVPLGTKLYVLYLRNNPETVHVARMPESALEYAASKVDARYFILSLVMIVAPWLAIAECRRRKEREYYRQLEIERQIKESKRRLRELAD